MKTFAGSSRFLIIILLASIAIESSGQGKKPNVLFIAVDDLKPYLEPYGDKIVKSPAISSIASNGVVFEKNYCQQAVCAPTRASLMTGLRPDRTGVWDLKTNFRIVDPSIVTMPEYLITQGYETAAFGKIYHPDTVTTFKGHDPRSWSIPYPDIKAPNYVTTDKKPAIENADVADSVYYDGKIALAAIKTLGNLAKGNKPFFLAVGFKKPHLPFVAPKKYWDLYKRDEFSIDPYQQKAKNGPDIAYHESKELKNYSDIEPFDSYSYDPGKHLSAEKQKELIHGYYACISYTDALINQLLVELKRLNLDKNTIVVLWGDHGWHLGDHGMWNKHSNFEQATHATLLFSVPWIKGGTKTSSITEFVDVYPTILDLLNVKAPQGLDGKSLVPIIKNPKATIHEYAVSQYPRPDDVMGYTIRADRYRYTEWIKKFKTYQPYDSSKVIAREFYDYEKDSHELSNEVANPKYSKQVTDLSKKIKAHFAQQYAVSKTHSGVALYYQATGGKPTGDNVFQITTSKE